MLTPYGKAIDDFHKLLRLCRTTRVRSPSKEELAEHEHLLPYLRHLNDLPVIVSAIFASPNWFLSDNVDHFSRQLLRKYLERGRKIKVRDNITGSIISDEVAEEYSEIEKELEEYLKTPNPFERIFKEEYIEESEEESM